MSLILFYLMGQNGRGSSVGSSDLNIKRALLDEIVKRIAGNYKMKPDNEAVGRKRAASERRGENLLVTDSFAQ